MATFDIAVRPGTWTLTVGDVSLEATGVIRDRGTVRCTLSVRNCGRLIFRDNVNLTGDRSRKRVLNRVREAESNIRVDATTLLALDEAIRITPRVESNGHNKKEHDTPPDVSGQVRTIGQLKERVRKWLLIEDDDALEIVLAVIVAHRLGGESPWLLLIAPPSGTKTEILRMTWLVPGIFPLSDLTARTFASGLDTHGDDPSLLARISEEILCLKDMTTLLEKHREERQAVLAQLRELYDGRFDMTWGTGKELHWTGRLGFLAGVTPVIDQHHAVMGLLGPRFLQLRLKASDRQEAAVRAMNNSGHEKAMRGELAAATADFLSHVSKVAPSVPAPTVLWLAQVADLVTRGRSPVLRDGWKREFEYAPEPESPARLSRQLYALLQGLTLVAGRTEPGPDEARGVARVAMDCIPGIRRLALDALAKSGGWLKTTQVASSVQHARTTVVRALEDLQALGLVLCEKDGDGQVNKWSLTDECRDMLLVISQPETSEGCHTHSQEGAGRYLDPDGSDASDASEAAEGLKQCVAIYSGPIPEEEEVPY